MAKPPAHKWAFRARFRRHAFGWRSQPAITRIKEAVSEIRKAARKDPVLAAEGAVLFLEKVSPAIEQVDGSSGSVGTAVNNAVAALVEVIAKASADEDTRMRWLDRLWDAYLADEMPYIESLGHHWGELCASPELASRWADRFLGVDEEWDSRSGLRLSHTDTHFCMSALLAAGRHKEILEQLGGGHVYIWPYRQYGVKALAAMGRSAAAIRYAEEGRTLNDSPVAIARACEEVLLAEGRVDEAYARYALDANQAGTYLAWFRAVAKKYPHKTRAEVLADLVAHTPGDEGKWFAAAKSAGLLEEAIALANHAPCAPQTLTRAARDFVETNPAFALDAGMAALRWLTEGYGYDITGADVWAAYHHTMKAAENLGVADETHEKIRTLVANETARDGFVTYILGSRLGLR